MQAKREYRDRDDTETAVLDALVGRNEEGMTVFELRSRVGTDIDDLETALSDLKAAGLITVEHEDDQIRIFPDGSVVPDPEAEADENGRSLFAKVRERLGF